MVKLYFDGGSFQSSKGGAQGKPASAGYVLYRREEAKAVGIPLPPDTTNNQAEFTGLIEGLKALKEAGVTRAHVIGDSQFVIRAMTGEYRVKAPHLKQLLGEARRAAEGMVIEWEWRRRENNSAADAICRKAASLGQVVIDIL